MNIESIIKELSFKAVRASGAGGQHVNKVSSKIVLTFDITSSNSLNDNEKERLKISLKSRLTNENSLTLSCSESRSQHKNKEIVIKRFLKIISDGLIVKKVRKKSRPNKASIRKRLEKKSRNALKKTNRRKPKIE
jgi:ribosome-associated protein